MLVKTNGDTRQATLTEDDLESGVIAQTKLNGVRLVAYLDRGEVVMYSRTGSLYPGMDNIRSDLMKTLQKAHELGFGRYYLDGEIYRHGESLLWISGQSRREQDDSSLQYYVFDCFDPTNPRGVWHRSAESSGRLSRADRPRQARRELLPQSMEEIDSLFKQFVRDGYGNHPASRSRAIRVLGERRSL